MLKQQTKHGKDNFKDGGYFMSGDTVSEIGAVVKVVDSHLCGWGSIPD